MKAKICAEANCNVLILQNERYCKAHKMEPVDNRNRKPFENAIRYNEELYKTSQWRKLRKEILKEQPVCSKCGADKGLHIHHIVPPRGNIELFYDRYNLITICGDCHRLETAREINNRN